MGDLVGILQTSGGDPPAGLLLALGLVLLFVIVLAARAAWDRLLSGPESTSTYRLREGGEGLVLADDEGPKTGRPIGLDDSQMDHLLELVEDRNEMRLHTVVARDGEEIDWEAWRAQPDRATPKAVVIEDSKGLVEIDVSGRVKATPPLDDAVRGDLLEVLETVA